MNAFQDDRVALGKIAADTRNIQAAVATPVLVRLLFVVLPDQPYQGQIRPEQPKQLINGRRAVEEGVEVFRRSSADVVVTLTPYVGEKGLDTQRRQQPAQGRFGVDAR